MIDTPQPDRWRILPVVLMAPLMGSLDGSIVNVALPAIARHLGVGMDGSQWVISSYLIVISAVVLIFGKIADLLGKERVFRWGFLVFGTGSLLCALSRNLAFLIAARVFLAIGAAMFMSANQGIIASIFPPNERGRALGLLGSTVAVGTMIGPPLGGIMVQLFNWPSLFLINIPISIFAFVAGGILLPREERRGTLAGFDLLGSALFVCFILGLFYFLLNGQNAGWESPFELAALTVAIVSLVLFIVRERRTSGPMIDLSIFKNILFSISVICVVIVFIANFGVAIIVPFFLQDALGLSPAIAGLIMLASPLGSGLVAPLSGQVSDRIGAEKITLVGLAVQLGAMLVLSLLGLGSSPVAVAACLGLFGIGSGIFASPNTKLIMNHAPPDRLGIAGSINALARNMGMVMGIAFGISILYGTMSASLGWKAQGFVPDHPQAFISGMRTVFLAASALLLIAIGISAARAFRRDR